MPMNNRMFCNEVKKNQRLGVMQDGEELTESLEGNYFSVREIKYN